MWDYEKLSVVTYPIYFIKTNCMQRIKYILMWEVLTEIAINYTNYSFLTLRRAMSQL